MVFLKTTRMEETRGTYTDDAILPSQQTCMPHRAIYSSLWIRVIRLRHLLTLSPFQRSTYKTLSPDLLAVSKQIQSEAVGYLYKQPIILEDTVALHTFLAAIGPSNRLQVTDLTVNAWGTGRGTHKAMNVAALTILAGCTNLKSIYLDCRIGWVRAPKQLALQLYRDGHYFFEAYGAANGRKDAAVDVLQLSECNYDRTNYYSWRMSADSLPASAEFKTQFQAELRKVLRK